MIRGTPGFRYDDVQGLNEILNIKTIHPRSYSLLCTLDSVNQLKWKHVVFEYGHRSDNDTILHLRREFVDTKQLDKKSKPKFTFAFEDERINVSYVSVTADVSVHLLNQCDFCCDFSFESCYHFIGFYSHHGPSFSIIRSMWHNMDFEQRSTVWIKNRLPHNWPFLERTSD